MTLVGAILETPDEVRRHVDDWDALAVELSRPYCAPGWLLPWWDRVAPAQALLRVAVALDGDRLCGIAPFYAVPAAGGLARYGLLGTESLSSRVEPLAAPGAQEAVGGAIARALSHARPVPAVLRFEGLPAGSPWPELLGRHWPGKGRASMHVEVDIPAPVVTLQGGFDAWLNSKSANFRQQVRQSQRRLAEAGASRRRVRDPAELHAALSAFESLHRARWVDRGGSEALKDGVMEMLADAGRALLASERFRLELIEVDGSAVGAHLFLSGGRETGYWLGGFDDDFAAARPSLVALVAAVEDGFARGDSRLDLGPGGQHYKYRLADGEDRLRWITLIPPGPQRRRALAVTAPRRLRHGVARRLSPRAKERLRRLARR